MKFNKKDLLILIIPLAIATVLYPFLPPQIPRQFTFSGEINYMAKESIFLLGVAPFLVYKYMKFRGK